MVNDTISDILTRIRNANLIKSQTVTIPLTRISKQICEILEKQGFIESFKIFPFSFHSDVKASDTTKNSQDKNLLALPFSNNKLKKDTSKVNSSSQEIIIYLKYQGIDKKPCITNLKRISKPGLRIYANHKEIPKILGGIGIAILSTSKGIMTDREARFHKIGGEILCSIW